MKLIDLLELKKFGNRSELHLKHGGTMHAWIRVDNTPNGNDDLYGYMKTVIEKAQKPDWFEPHEPPNDSRMVLIVRTFSNEGVMEFARYIHEAKEWRVVSPWGSASTPIGVPFVWTELPAWRPS